MKNTIAKNLSFIFPLKTNSRYDRLAPRGPDTTRTEPTFLLGTNQLPSKPKWTDQKWPQFGLRATGKVTFSIQWRLGAPLAPTC